MATYFTPIRTSHNAFTLIEVLITVVILSIGIVTVLRALDASLFHAGVSRDALLATMLIREKMAELETSILQQNDIKPGLSSGRFLEPYSSFRWEQRVQQVPGLTDVPAADRTVTHTLNEVVLTVCHENARRKHSLTTYLRTSKKL